MFKTYTEAAETLRQGADSLDQSLSEDGEWSAAKLTGQMREFADRIVRLDDSAELMLSSPVDVVALQNHGASQLEELVTRRADWLPSDARTRFQDTAAFLRQRSQEIADEFGFDASLGQGDSAGQSSTSSSDHAPGGSAGKFFSRLADTVITLWRSWRGLAES